MMFKAMCGAAGLAAGLIGAQAAQAAQFEVFFSGEVDGVSGMPGFTEGQPVQGSFLYESAAPLTSSPGEYAGAVSDIFVDIIEDLGGGNFGAFPVIENESGDVFVGQDSIEWFFGPAPGQLADNFNLVLEGGPDFGFSLLAATAELEAAGGNAGALFSTQGFGVIDNGFTDGNLGYSVDFIQVTLVPEPASAVLLLTGGACLRGRRRRG